MTGFEIAMLMMGGAIIFMLSAIGKVLDAIHAELKSQRGR